MLRPVAETTPVVTVWLKPKRVAYCDYAFAGHDVGRIAKLPGGRQISAGPSISSTARSKLGSLLLYPGGKFASVLQVNHYLIAGHNMGIRRHKAILAVNDYARTWWLLRFFRTGVCGQRDQKIGPGPKNAPAEKSFCREH